MKSESLSLNRYGSSTNTCLVKVIVFALILSFIYSGCSLFESNDTSEPVIKDVPFEILRQSAAGQLISTSVSKCTFNWSNIDLSGLGVSAEDLSGIELIISNEEDFEVFLDCNEDQTDINLNTDFILAGLTTMQGNGVHVENQSVSFTGDTLRYNVELWSMAMTIPDRAQYMVLIPDAYREYPVDFNIYWREE